MLISIERKTVRSEPPSKTYNIKQKRLSVKNQTTGWALTFFQQLASFLS